MRIVRSTVFTAAVAVLAAACGDKVTVAGPTTLTTTTTTTTTPAAAGTVKSIAVAPASATLTVGQSINLTAAVQADAGIATTVTWTSSDATKAGVDATGKVSAVAATPGVAICATSTVNTSMKGCATIVVTSAAVTIPATASIAGVFAGNLTTPVDPSNVAGNVFVQVNVNPGTQTVSKVVLTVGGVRVDSQSFTAAQAAALRFAADQASAEQAQVSTITMTVNTAAVINGVPLLKNGANQAIAVLVFTAGNTAATATASNAASITLNNLDKIIASIAPASGTVTTATSVLGYQWTKLTDSTDVSFNYISYSGRTPTSLSVTPFCGDTAWTKVVSPFKIRYGQSATGYQTQNSVGVCSATAATDGEAPTFNSAVMSDGNSAPAGLALDAATTVALRKRYDNVGPAAPTITLNVGISGTKLTRAQGWLNDAARLTSVRGSTEGSTANYTGAAVASRGADAGVSAGAATTDAQIPTYRAFIGADLATALASTAVTSTTGLAETAGQTLCLVVRGTDALGNMSPAPTSCTFNASTNTAASFIGIDRTAPSYARFQNRGTDTTQTVTYSKLAPDSLWAGGRIAVFTADTATGAGTAGASGINGVVFAVTRTDNGVATCIYGTASTCVTSTTGNVTTQGGGSGSTFAGADDYPTASQAANGYYQISATAYDRAGNSLAVAARNVLFDNTVPTVGAVVGLNAIGAGLQSGRVTAASDDNVGLGYVQIANQYVAAATDTLRYICGRADIATSLSATSLVITDARAITGCSAPANYLLKTDTVAANITGALTDPTANQPYALQSAALVTSYDYAGNASTAAAAALNTVVVPTAANVLTAMGTQRASNLTTCPSAWPLTGFCRLTVSSTGATPVYNGTGSNAQSTVNLQSTVTVVDSVLIATVAPSVDSTVAQAKTAQLTNLRNVLTASPFRSMTFLVYSAQSAAPGAPTAGTNGIVIAGALDAAFSTNSVTGLSAETVDSITTPTYYKVSRTWRYVAAFTPDKYLGTYSPILGRSADFTATAGQIRFYALGNYSYPGSSAVQATTQAGAWQFRIASLANGGQTLGTTTRSTIGVLSPVSAAITVRR